MLLCIDCGNTNTVFSIWDGKKFLTTWRTSTEWQRTADQYFVWLSTLMEAEHIDVIIDEVIISSTVPRVVFNLRVLCDRYFHTRPLVVGKPECKLPIEIRVDNPAEVGADRLVNTIAAFDRYGGELIVVDFGTATTLDVVAHDGAYIGGAIAPGINLSLDALHHAAAHLPRIDVTMPPHVLGRNTVHCMQSGIYWGYVGLIEGMVKRIKKELGAGTRVVATGGLANVLAVETTVIETVDQMLTLEGLRLIHDLNKKR